MKYLILNITQKLINSSISRNSYKCAINNALAPLLRCGYKSLTDTIGITITAEGGGGDDEDNEYFIPFDYAFRRCILQYDLSHGISGINPGKYYVQIPNEYTKCFKS